MSEEMFVPEHPTYGDSSSTISGEPSFHRTPVNESSVYSMVTMLEYRMGNAIVEMIKEIRCCFCGVIFRSRTSCCLNNHYVCWSCRAINMSCYVCRNEFFPSTWTFFNLWVRDLMFPCRGMWNGCRVKLPLDEILAHQEECPYVQVIKCSYYECGAVVSSADYGRHYAAHYSDIDVSEIPARLCVRFGDTWSVGRSCSVISHKGTHLFEIVLVTDEWKLELFVRNINDYTPDCYTEIELVSTNTHLKIFSTPHPSYASDSVVSRRPNFIMYRNQSFLFTRNARMTVQILDNPGYVPYYG